jgi:hypothetical protein
MEMIDLQNEFATRLASSIKSPWDEIRVHYENAVLYGESREVYSASFRSNGVEHDLDISLEALDVLLKLKQCKPKNQQDEWIWFEFFIDKAGRYKFDYIYTDPPLIMQQLKYSK